jgi:hypothetical protein
LDEWGKARNKSVKVLDRLRKETSEVVGNFVNQEQERQTNFLHRIKEESAERDKAVEQMAKAVLTGVWQGILEDKLGQNLVLFLSSGDQGLVKVSNVTFLVFNDRSLAEKVTHICNLAVNNLCKADTVPQLRDEVHRMKKATEELREMLNPVKLTPMILRTRCDLCPA